MQVCTYVDSIRLSPSATDRVMNVTFLRYTDGLKVDIPLKPVNSEMNVPIKRGAFFLQVSRFLKCRVETPNIPPFLAVDLANAENKQVIRLNGVSIPPGVTPLMKDPNFCVGTLVGKRLD